MPRNKLAPNILSDLSAEVDTTDRPHRCSQCHREYLESTADSLAKVLFCSLACEDAWVGKKVEEGVIL
jgi:hypothetical protein